MRQSWRAMDINSAFQKRMLMPKMDVVQISANRFCVMAGHFQKRLCIRSSYLLAQERAKSKKTRDICFYRNIFRYWLRVQFSKIINLIKKSLFSLRTSAGYFDLLTYSGIPELCNTR